MVEEWRIPMGRFVRRVAVALAAVGVSTVVSTSAAQAEYLWIASGTWPTQAECVYWKNWAVVEYDIVVEPKTNNCFHDPGANGGYFYRIRNEF